MACDAACMSLSKSVNSSVAPEMSRLCIRMESAIDLVAKFLLRIGEELALRRRILGRSGLVVLLLPGCGNQLFLALGDFGLVTALTASTTTAASAAALLRLRKLALERIDLDEGISVRASLLPSFAVA